MSTESQFTERMKETTNCRRDERSCGSRGGERETDDVEALILYGFPHLSSQHSGGLNVLPALEFNEIPLHPLLAFF